MAFLSHERLERVVFTGGAGVLCLLAFALQRATAGHSWEAVGIALVATLVVVGALQGRRPASRGVAVALVSVYLTGLLVWLFASSAAVRVGAFVTAVVSQAAIIVISWKRGAPIMPPLRDTPITLNLSSR